MAQDNNGPKRRNPTDFGELNVSTTTGWITRTFNILQAFKIQDSRFFLLSFYNTRLHNEMKSVAPQYHSQNRNHTNGSTNNKSQKQNYFLCCSAEDELRSLTA